MHQRHEQCGANDGPDDRKWVIVDRHQQQLRRAVRANLVANAEAALRSAKQQNVPLLFYGPEMNARAAESLRMENRLRRALEMQQLSLWYQPKISVKTGRLTGFEALMRWNDPELGMIPPGKFIPVMEQTGLILELGRRVLREACREAATWPGGGTGGGHGLVEGGPVVTRTKVDHADGRAAGFKD